ncbi:DUF1805 domain-containing protein [Virgibacillus sp. MSJ-26]|uniref:YunC family protein n=1 Tax=Virgibacillus sp. MSJ-26 TaxID=2841522 RepID=UPI001C103FA7|nr:DUF1805 domain-containing protein [Virgibacillus sp. MSJ-26]MBU5467249.1 DUF1805 domain-containing protein [Virgibacillus sp. MSJ-26]
MITIKPLEVDGKQFTAVCVALPKTNLLTISNDVGYIMCAALDVDVFDASEKLREREVIAGRAFGVRTIDDLLHAPLQKVTSAAEEKFGWEEGMIGKDALLKLT